MTNNIVLVEDEMVVGLEIRKTLERLGYGLADVLTDGASAVDYVEGNPVDLVLMDVRLDGSMDGVEATERIHGMTDVPVVFVTSYSDDDTIDRIKSTDASGYILKPFHKNDLDQALSYALGDGDEKPSLKNGDLFFERLREWLAPGAWGLRVISVPV